VTRDEYEAAFADGAGAACLGEASVWYLWSQTAAQEICDYNPDARVIAMLRNPVDMLASLHSQYMFDQIEDLKDFREAVAAEPDRRAGHRIPPNNGPYPWRLLYREVAGFHDQLERYFRAFGPDRVHVIIFDDFVTDLPGAYRRVLEFLGVDPNFVPSLDVHNQNKQVRSGWLRQQLLRSQEPSSRARRIMRLMPPNSRRRSALTGAAALVGRLNTSTTTRPSVDPELRATLASELAPEVMRLSELLDRDLSNWLPDKSEAQEDVLRPAAAVPDN
jgi:hypothetical protein